MAILLTGGTGKTSLRCARLCKVAGVPFILASRKAVSKPDMPAAKFDYTDKSTFENPLQHQFPSGEKISAIYLSASEQFSDQQYLPDIRNESKFYTANGDGKAPWVSSLDIAKVAFKVLTDEKPHNTDYRVLGPEQLTCDEIAAKLTKALKREIKHIKLSREEKVKKYMSLGFPEPLSQFMPSLEVRTAEGMEERPDKDFEKVVGEKGQTFDEWIQESKQAWL